MGNNTPFEAGGFAPKLEQDVDEHGLMGAGGTITQRFAAVVSAAPSAIALLQNGEAMSYSELDLHSNRLARYLRRMGVGKDDVVALITGRSVASIVSIIAILKIGAAYAPLEPSLPPELLRWLVKDCGAVCVLNDARHYLDVPATNIGLQEALAASSFEQEFALDDRTASSSMAYVMYTSGSTGRPKGVSVPHRGVVRLVSDQSYARFGSDEVLLHAAPLAFDASTFEIWGALLHGAQLAVVPQDRPSLQQIVDVINRTGVTTAWFTAGLFHLLVERQLHRLGGLRQIIAGGDILSPTHVLRALATLPNCQLINGYGPTENTTFTCCYRVPRSGWGGGPVPIGVPIQHTYVRLLDDGMEPVADGEVGHLFAGGLGLASGYVGDAAYASTKFFPDPLKPEALLYQTGDLARLRPDGMLEFVGRCDRQIKIDGKRVELGEIEEVLRRSDAIADALVVAEKSHVGSLRLTGYIKPAHPNQDDERLVSRARIEMQAALPLHMRPSTISVVDEFPLTANGKIDLQRLTRSPSGEGALEQDPIEATLQRIFSRVLGVEDIGVNRNFFDLGATSLQLVEAHALIEETWSVLSVVSLFEHPTIQGLARLLRHSPDLFSDSHQTQAEKQRKAIQRLRHAGVRQ